MKTELLSGLMVTRPASRALVPLAIGDFAHQTCGARELVIVHDGDAPFDTLLRELCASHALDAVVERAVAGQTLGAMRNRSVELARGDVVAQWDDDDRHHPSRLLLQLDALHAQCAVAAFSTEQIHWFPARGAAFWEDWHRDAWPLDVVQGTLVALKAQLPRYPEVARGEDTALMHALAARGASLARVTGIGWSYVYAFHGGNAWDAGHHAASALGKGLSPARLIAREATLRARLAEYDPPLPPMHFPHAAGAIDIGVHAAPAGRNRRASAA